MAAKKKSKAKRTAKSSRSTRSAGAKAKRPATRKTKAGAARGGDALEPVEALRSMAKSFAARLLR